MLSLRQSLALIGKKPPIRIPTEVSMPCRSLKDTLTAWNHLPYRLLIIAPQEFVEVLKPLVDHKNNTRIPTMLKSLEHIYQAYPGRDEAEKVKRCLALFQPNNSVKYAMLVGDEDRFPVRFVKWFDFDSTKAFQTWYVPTDFYYAALFKDKEDGFAFDDWDKNQDGYFGETPPFGSKVDNTGPINPDDAHSNPCLAVGRIPASTSGEVTTYVQKVITYEKEAYNKDWTKAALLVHGDWMDCRAALNDMASKYLQGYNVHYLYLQGGLGTEFPSPDNINKYINPPEGVSFVVHAGHGNNNEWQIDGITGISYLNHGRDPKNRGDIDNLDNSDRLPIVFSIGCDTGQFVTWPPLSPYCDVNGIDHNGTSGGDDWSTQGTPPQPACLQPHYDFESMAEGMTVERRMYENGNLREKGTGAIAYIGSILGGWDGTYQALLKFFEEIPPIPLNGKTLGEMWLNMLTKYLEHNKPPDPAKPANTVGSEIVYILQIWHLGLFGDPSLRVGGIPS